MLSNYVLGRTVSSDASISLVLKAGMFIVHRGCCVFGSNILIDGIFDS